MMIFQTIIYQNHFSKVNKKIGKLKCLKDMKIIKTNGVWILLKIKNKDK